MNYCERCQICFEGDVCLACNSKKIREVNDNDFCFFSTMEETWGKIFIDLLKASDVPCVALPITDTVVALKAPGTKMFKIFVAYKDIPIAKELLNLLVKK